MSIRLEHDGAQARLVIDRAERRNAMTLAMWQAIPGLLERAAALPGLRMLVVRAARPGAFCAGADLAELLDHKADPDWLLAQQDALGAAQRALAGFPLPTLAFVEGDAIGGGGGIAAACDMRVATAAARFAFTPSKLGLIYPLHDIKLLVELVGPGHARRLLYGGALIDAAEALRIGLVEAIADSPDAFITPILAASPHSTRETKRFVRRILDGQIEDDAATRAIFADAFRGPDFHEGIAAFIDKRPAEFGR